MDKRDKKGYIIGKTSTRELNVINQVAPYIQSEYASTGFRQAEKRRTGRI